LNWWSSWQMRRIISSVSTPSQLAIQTLNNPAWRLVRIPPRSPWDKQKWRKGNPLPGI
jgi:hypothetical protein